MMTGVVFEAYVNFTQISFRPPPHTNDVLFFLHTLQFFHFKNNKLSVLSEIWSNYDVTLPLQRRHLTVMHVTSFYYIHVQSGER